MYAGTFVTNDTTNHNLFYWHFRNASVPDAPLVLWINGGPGASSMFGLFLENGPIRVSRNGTGVDDY
jgi:vitellogenic carboxypeptidase-like protein